MVLSTRFLGALLNIACVCNWEIKIIYSLVDIRSHRTKVKIDSPKCFSFSPNMCGVFLYCLRYNLVAAKRKENTELRILLEVSAPPGAIQICVLF